MMQFLCEAFSGEVLTCQSRPDGSIMHAEVRIGDSMVMLGEANDEFGPMTSSLYLYVPDCDAVYRRALDAGGSCVFEITNLPSGERYGGVKDPCGNVWWIATHVEDVPPEEQAQRWREFKR
jgi:uncharacterized glyoxalase superfamily protein PhnB